MYRAACSAATGEREFYRVDGTTQYLLIVILLILWLCVSLGLFRLFSYRAISAE